MVNVKDPRATTWPPQVTVKDTIKTIKGKMAKQIHISAAEQVLICNSKVLKSRSAVNTAGLVDVCAIHLNMKGDRGAAAKAVKKPTRTAKPAEHHETKKTNHAGQLHQSPVPF